MKGDIKSELTSRELETLGQVAQGFTYVEIAKIHGVVWQTVKNQMALVRLRLQARTSAHAVAIAKDKNLI